MAPSDFIQSRQLAAQGHGQYFTALVDGRPYLPNFTVDYCAPSSSSSSSASACSSSSTSVCHAAIIVIVLNSIYATAVASTTPTPTNYYCGKGDAKNIMPRSGSLASDTTPDLSLKSIPMIDDDWWDDLLLTSSPALTCTKVTGGITNALFRVSGFETLGPAIAGAVAKLFEDKEEDGGGDDDDDGAMANTSDNDVNALLRFDSVLIRIFGAEGMIDRDVETSTYAALCDANIADRYLGRFKNGRVEGWLDGFEALTCSDLAKGNHSVRIAKEMARLHCLFRLPKGELRDHHYGTDVHASKVGLWDQMSSWMEQAKSYTDFQTKHDTERVKCLELDKIEREVQFFISSFASDSSDVDSDKRRKKIVFCHNDLLPANIMFNQQTNKIQFIDFEYGGVGYAAYDVANHFNEYAGGTSAEDNGVPDYSRFPTYDKQKAFCEEYVREVRRYEGGDMDCQAVNDFLDDVQKFLLINHLYWGLWAVNQAAEEGCDGFDYVSFATNRFKQFYAMKET